MSSDLRELKNYPIFLLSLVDSLVTGPGYVWQFITRQFVVYHQSNFPEMFFTQAPKFYSNLRSVLQRALQIPITENVNPFWFSCMPNLVMVRFNEYAFGICSALLAYERYVCVCKVTQKTTLLSGKRRRKLYFLATFLIISITIADSVFSYLKSNWNCFYAFDQSVGITPVRVVIISLCLLFVYSLIPATFCLYYYYNIIRVLVNRSKKVGRNSNLITCFATICFVWIFCLVIKLVHRISTWIILHKADEIIEHLDNSFIKNHGFQDVMVLLGSVTSIIDPLLILVCQKDYRKPFLAQIERFEKMYLKIRGRQT